MTVSTVAVVFMNFTASGKWTAMHRVSAEGTFDFLAYLAIGGHCSDPGFVNICSFSDGDLPLLAIS